MSQKLPTWIRHLEDEWFIPRWLSMDGNTPCVYALDIERSLLANRPLLTEAY